MSSTEFSASGGTRTIEAGDTPSLDYLGVSVAMAAENIPKGTPCWIIGGFVTIADGDDPTGANTFPLVPVVPTESKDNSTGSPGDLEIRVVPIHIHKVFTYKQKIYSRGGATVPISS